MTASPQPPWTPAPRADQWNAGRVVALVLGSVLLLVSIPVLLGGAAVLAADRTERTDGYLISPAETFAGAGHALVSERIDVSTGADWVPLSAALGTARIQVAASDPADAVFIGIAPADDLSAYLDGVERTVIDDLGVDAAPGTLVPGGEPSGPPGDQDFWTTWAEGPGTQQLTWEPAQGNWMLVVMNADGSPGISVDARIGATLPALDGLARGLIVSGLVGLAIAVLLMVLAIRRPSGRRGPAQPGTWPVPGGQPPAGPPSAGQLPPWVLPAQADRTTAPDGQPSAEHTPKRV